MNYDSYSLAIINRDCKPLLELAESHSTWWPEFGFESLLSTRACALLLSHMRSNLRMPALRDIEQGFCAAYKQETPRERVIAALKECCAKELASRS